MTKPIPTQIDGARVVFYTLIDQRHRPTGYCRHFVDGQLSGPAGGLAICQYEGEDNYYLFYCDEDWNTVTDTFHLTLPDAKRQAAWEYEGVNETWQPA